MLKLGLSRCCSKAPLRGDLLKLTTNSQLGVFKGSSPLARNAAVVSSVRFNSTSSSSAPEIKDKLVSFANDVAGSSSSSSSHASDAAGAAGALHSDQIGYLQSIGLGQGWGPTSIIENLLEMCHVYTGLPWWGTIAVVTVAVRVVLFPLYVKASSNATRMSKIKPQLDEILQELKDDSNENMQDKMRLMEKRKKLMKTNNVSTLASLAPVVQLPLAYGFFQALRKMANYPVEGFQDQGILWFENLSSVDPYLGLQALAAVAVIIVVRTGGETGQHAMAKNMQKVMTVVPLASIFITKGFSAAVVFYFAINSVLSLIQSLIFKSTALRRMLGMPKKFTSQQLAAANKNKPDVGVKEWFKNYVEDSKKKSIKKARDYEKKLEVTKQRRSSGNDGFIKKRS
ncbi:uncharacterized protein LODBEIA_P59110 [Lodderomyces beijingensis]|uniref:Membrane insertase YidC/Oxa/ALB C-terminal domain-containing protein n=1 Tax=Lodderomyces beijingensis TaxID=1775926 RepID=A0ABP0ZWT0_9ASCO